VTENATWKTDLPTTIVKLSRDDSRVTANLTTAQSTVRFIFRQRVKGKKVGAREFVASGYQLCVSLINAGKAHLPANSTIIQIAGRD